MRETRVNLKHLLEDIRDSYSQPIEETIITELTANSLDSKASQIEFLTDPSEGGFIICDNGQGMKRKAMKDYHNIAATTKIRGRGIGFAGIGSKLSLLLAKSVITETKGGRGSHCSTQWYLMDENRAPWNFSPNPGKVLSSRGTAVIMELSNPQSLLFSPDFIIAAIKKHFEPLLHPQFNDPILKYIYKKGVAFYVNGENIKIEDSAFESGAKTFRINFGGKQRGLAGFGYLVKSKEELLPEDSGISISTYGKVIKRGWEWLGLMPKSGFQISGMVEIPALSEILTTNKSDFLKDAASLKKYYKYRKAIQAAVLPILEDLGEKDLSFESDLKRLRPLEREIEKTLGYLLNDFPELTPLVGVRRKTAGESVTFSPEEIPSVGIIHGTEKIVEATSALFREEGKKGSAAADVLANKEKKKAPGLKIGFEENSARPDLARMVQNTIWVNTFHPAYRKSKKEGLEEYHILLCVAWALSGFIEEDRSPQDFISQFLASWAGYEGAGKIFRKSHHLPFNHI